mgnify:CR=1 FL=1
MIDRDHGLSVGRQAKALGISRGSVCYLPRPASDADLALMRRIDKLHLEHPFAGSRMLEGLLQADGHAVGRLHVPTLIRKMAIEALYIPSNEIRDLRAVCGSQAATPAAAAPAARAPSNVSPLPVRAVRNLKSGAPLPKVKQSAPSNLAEDEWEEF